MYSWVKVGRRGRAEKAENSEWLWQPGCVIQGKEQSLGFHQGDELELGDIDQAFVGEAQLGDDDQGQEGELHVGVVEGTTAGFETGENSGGLAGHRA
jgi:hypothetical protein